MILGHTTGRFLKSTATPLRVPDWALPGLSPIATARAAMEVVPPVQAFLLSDVEDEEDNAMIIEGMER